MSGGGVHELSDLRHGLRDRPDALGHAVDMGGDAALCFGEPLLETEFEWRWRGGERIVHPSEEVVEDGALLGPTSGFAFEAFLRVADVAQGLEDSAFVPLRQGSQCLPALAAFELAFDLLGVGPVARDGRGDSGGGRAHRRALRKNRVRLRRGRDRRQRHLLLVRGPVLPHRHRRIRVGVGSAGRGRPSGQRRRGLPRPCAP